MPVREAELHVHDVLNVFQVTGLDPVHEIYFMEPSPARKGDFLEFFAEIDLLCAISTCPSGDLSQWGWGEDGSDPLAAAAKAKTAGITIVTVGIGSRNDAVTVHGQRVGGVDDQALGAIASATGGKYYFAEEAGQLSQIYTNLGSSFGWRFVRFDATASLIVAGTLIVLTGSALSLYWFRVLP